MRKLGMGFVLIAMLVLASCQGELPDSVGVGQKTFVRECGALLCQDNLWQYTEEGWERCACGLPPGTKADEVKCS